MNNEQKFDVEQAGDLNLLERVPSAVLWGPVMRESSRMGVHTSPDEPYRTCLDGRGGGWR